MAINSISDFEAALRESMETLFGNCRTYEDVLRSVCTHLGVSDAGAIVEAAFEAGFNPDAPYPVLHFHTTLAQKIDEEKIPGILKGINELNTVISAGAFPSFGCFGFYAPLSQIYLSYRMPVNPEVLEAEFENARFYLGSLYEELDLFTDFIMFLCNDPENLTIDAYMDYLDTIADLDNIEARLEFLEKVVGEYGKDQNEEGE